MTRNTNGSDAQCGQTNVLNIEPYQNESGFEFTALDRNGRYLEKAKI